MRQQVAVSLMCMTALLAGCSDDTPTGAPVFGENTNPPKSSIEKEVPVDVGTPDASGADTTSGCDTVECCEESLGITSTPCAEVVLTDGVCEVVDADEGTACPTDATCTVGTCSSGQCVGAPVECPSDSPCMEMACNPETGACEGTPLQDGQSCSDAPSCVGASVCEAGECIQLEPVECKSDPGTQCQEVVCDPVDGCLAQPTPGAGCNDGSPCTVDDTCADDGECGGTNVCECDSDLDCVIFFGLCDAALTCQDGSCVPTTPAVDCDDGNPCTDDSCDPATGVCEYLSNTNDCDDGSACTFDDQCQEGECVGTATDCDDDDPCTDGESCDPATGECLPGTGSCPECETPDDCPSAEPCGGTWACTAGQCVYDDALAVDCENADVGPCAVSSCDAATNACVVTTLPNGEFCDDGDPCTEGDACADGVCNAGPPTVCVDDNPCTADSCDPATGCEYKPLSGETCDDGSKCTTGDICDAGECKSTAPKLCDDDNPCTTDICDPETGCTYTPAAGVPCDDGDECTTGDACTDAGACKAAQNICGCQTNDDCVDDGDACNGTPVCLDNECVIDPTTIVVCDQPDSPCSEAVCIAGECETKPTTGADCNDGSACTTGDTCANGLCKGTAVGCDDGNQCTADSCDPETGCVYDVTVGDCDDGNACTTDESCSAAGECGGGLPVSCDDGNLCTSEICTAASGCKYSDAVGACNDGDACTTGDFCKEGECAGAPVVCTGGDGVCNLAACNEATGACEVTAVDCDDDNACTADSCDPTAGCNSTAIDCSDDNLCTIESCDQEIGCQTDAVVCDDGLACTDDFCDPISGLCGALPVVCPPGAPCEVGSCDEAVGACTYEFTCDDGNACTTDSCVDSPAGKTCENIPVDCSDDNPCTQNTCNPDTGACVAIPAVCDDQNPCTTDTCDPEAGGCVYAPLCDDGDDCTVDECVDGECKVSALCDDSDPCTTDVCAAGVCDFQPVECDDGVECTADACVEGACEYTPSDEVCNDDNQCTTDVCDLALGCQNAPANGLACDDGNECTENDTCAEGLCKPGAVVCGPCEDEDEGASCNDGDEDTVADICWQGTCAGFETYVTSPVGITGPASLGKVLWTAGSFVTIGASGDDDTTSTWLARVVGGSVVVEAGTTLVGPRWVDLTHDLVVADDGTSLQYVDGAWTSAGWVPGVIAALAAGEDITFHAAYWSGEGPVTVAGVLDDAAFVARCTPAAGCVYEQINVNFADEEIPKAIGAWPEDTAGTTGNELILATDLPAGGSNYYNDSFRRSINGSWEIEFFDEGASDKRTQDVTGSSPTNAYWVGDNGLLLYRDSEAEWAFKLDAINNQSVTDLKQAWTGDGIALVSASREHGNDKRTLYVVTHDTSTNAGSTNNWERHEVYDQNPVECEGSPVCIPSFGGFDQPADLSGVAAYDQTILLTGWRRNPETGAREPIHFIRK